MTSTNDPTAHLQDALAEVALLARVYDRMANDPSMANDPDDARAARFYARFAGDLATILDIPNGCAVDENIG